MNTILRLIAFGLLIANCSFAQQLILTHTGTGSGALKSTDGNLTILSSFSNAAFTITEIVDPAYRREVYNSSSILTGYSIHDSLVTIHIADFGDFAVTYPGTQAIFGAAGGVAWTRDDHGAGADLLDGPISPSFGSWDMMTATGPISGTAVLLQWGEIPWVYTAQGILMFDTTDTSSPFDSTFTATVIPEPATYAVLCALGTLGAAAYRRWRRLAG